jgi:hypothetical protein
MKRVLVVSALAVIVVGLVYAQTRPEKPSPVTSRYQLVPATASYEGKDGRQAEGPAVFLLDTESGRVWTYEFGRIEKKAADGSVIQYGFPPYFEEIPVGFDSPLLERQLELLEKSRHRQKQP